MPKLTVLRGGVARAYPKVSSLMGLAASGACRSRRVRRRIGHALGHRSLANLEFRLSLTLPHAIGSMLQLVEIQSKPPIDEEHAWSVSNDNVALLTQIAHDLVHDRG